MADHHASELPQSPGSITLPIIDDHEYRLITLGNGLRALLVHDATAEKGAAACDVSVNAKPRWLRLPPGASKGQHSNAMRAAICVPRRPGGADWLVGWGGAPGGAPLCLAPTLVLRSPCGSPALPASVHGLYIVSGWHGSPRSRRLPAPASAASVQGGGVPPPSPLHALIPRIALFSLPLPSHSPCLSSSIPGRPAPALLLRLAAFAPDHPPAALLALRRSVEQVRVGSLSDPDDVPGLAHFTEHMLFYSSHKYPEEDEYRWAWGRVVVLVCVQVCAGVRRCAGVQGTAATCPDEGKYRWAGVLMVMVCLPRPWRTTSPPLQQVHR